MANIRANISDEHIEAIHNKIVIDLCIHALEGKIEKALKAQQEEQIDLYKLKLKELLTERKELNSYLRQRKTKIQEVIICDDMFVEYPYYLKTKEGGIKQGTMRYWKAALKLHMKNKLNGC
ncbi:MULTISPECIES: hypothetical protein [Bacillus]|uniref:Transcriptional regulator n=2 Tax=Bacillus TaxID=1386 RepID=A0ABU6H882_9BACI|nr:MULTISPECIES: hypothetical protein [Bacillus]MEC0341961.1 hypothetical protein [Bacillus sonorensis]MEC0457525.1 hypothetical protein [Bacillus sonorensis]MEC0487201.1 hypothetical protein [Bacillus glycinifermentans]MEC0530680.1 hypothetical protein [Bacillus sonorensis]UBF35293.1 hypothetical protein K9N56_24210 [Bacillus sp. PM8313]